MNVAQIRRRFEHFEDKLNEVHGEVYALWTYIEQQRRKIEALQKRVAALVRRNSRKQSKSKKRRR